MSSEKQLKKREARTLKREERRAAKLASGSHDRERKVAGDSRAAGAISVGPRSSQIVLLETTAGNVISIKTFGDGSVSCEVIPKGSKCRFAKRTRITESAYCRRPRVLVKDVRDFVKNAACGSRARDIFEFASGLAEATRHRIGGRRVRIASAVSGELLCEIDAEETWDMQRVKGEIEISTGIAIAHQRVIVGSDELRSATDFFDFLMSQDSTSVPTVSILQINWVPAVASTFPEIYKMSEDLRILKRAGCVTQLLGEDWVRCSDGGQLSSVASTPDYFVAFKLEIAESWRQRVASGQILLFTGNGFPDALEYPLRYPDFALECGGQPKLLVIVSSQAYANHHITGGSGQACTHYDLPTDVELSVVLAVAGDTAAVYIDGEEVCREWVGSRFAHERLEVFVNPPDEGWISQHGYEVPNPHARIRHVFYVSFPEPIG